MTREAEIIWQRDSAAEALKRLIYWPSMPLLYCKSSSYGWVYCFVVGYFKHGLEGVKHVASSYQCTREKK